MMGDMHDTGHDSRSNLSSIQARYLLLLTLILSLAAYLRFDGLGDRSLWLDEFCTWHVSRLDLGDSLRWEPELTIPPLYQMTLRALTSLPHPPEWLLRLPAAVCGILSVLAAYWLGKVLRNRAIGCALAGLVACSALQLKFSQEARPYTMLVLGCTLSVTLWYRLVTRPRGFDFWAYVAATTLTFYAHFLVVLTVLAQLLWWLAILVRRPAAKRSLRPLFAFVITAVLCTPLVARSVTARSSVTGAIAWIDPPTWERTARMLNELTYGPLWMAVFVGLAAVAWVAVAKGRVSLSEPGREPDDGIETRGEAVALLLTWLVCAWAGLVLISLFLLPVTVTRYALPAAIPALLLPLLFADWFHRGASLILAAVFVMGTAPDWITRNWEVPAGFRELTTYVREHVDPETEAVVLTVGHAEAPHWVEMQRLALEYYPLDNCPVYELLLEKDDQSEPGSILEDPRRLYLIVFRSDPFSVILDARRRPEAIEYEGTSYSQLLFSPYRLICVAPQTEPRP